MPKTKLNKFWGQFQAFFLEIWHNPRKRRDFGIGLLILASYLIFNFARGLLDNWMFGEHTFFTYRVAKIISTSSYWFGNLSWLVLVYLIIISFFKKKRPFINYGIFGGCLILLLFFLTGAAAIFHFFF